MTSSKALCVTSDFALRRTLKRTLGAAGSTVEFCDSLAQAEGECPQLLVLDQDARRSENLPDLISAMGDGGEMLVVGDTLQSEGVLELMRHAQLNHVIADPKTLDESELVVTSVKIITGDIFGVEKYLAWGSKVHETAVRDYSDKRIAMLQVCEHAKLSGARRSLVAKIESVTDELLMNALYDAPAVAKGGDPSRKPKPSKVQQTMEPLPDAKPALLRYACDGRYFAISVQDNYGELHKDAILDHVARAIAEGGAPKNDTVTGGAGLGLYFILSSVTRFIANIDPNRRTEVIALFDLRVSGREREDWASSLHVFVKRDDPEEARDVPLRLVAE